MPASESAGLDRADVYLFSAPVTQTVDTFNLAICSMHHLSRMLSVINAVVVEGFHSPPEAVPHCAAPALSAPRSASF